MRIVKNLAVAAITVTMFSCGNQVKEVKSLDTELDSVSYAVGLSMSGQLKSTFSEVDKDVLSQGIRNGLDSTNLLIETKDIQKILSSYFQKKQQAQMIEQQEKAAKAAEAKFGENKKAGEAFLAANKSKEGVKTTESGIQYIVLKEGSGEKPAGPTSRVKVHYHGTNIEGKVFDSSVERGTPSEFGLNQVIKGWTEGVQLMNEGAKYKFFIPQELAYGPQQKSAEIKPFSTLIFEIELLEVIK
ncbi:FKBP-type peptidyl-prolyl cis-trans isomerase [Polaribacter sp. IC073]|uniref:FKBP-type peptidyl-prolyl cis-trans isomerase n=1 Tax=Polaribacter sp. IC073 TaxID=2508540 RepID=UPI0011BD847A|nr:FKBP-type peptidyl-prolyl cis-trans isomerase [Polaribacter sp. IC073]TXD49055.1 FKBP-type peptidyl-prolyl cis-trans isomerase [Polaribacter sp. IC073]